MKCWSTLFLAGLVSQCLSYQSYQDKIPNGRSVPHPCKPNYIWYGVGHQKVLGTGSRNPFGEAFAAANRVWTEDLCNQDSDGDGKSNGEELGDVNCTWTEGTSPSQTSGLSHPGVCEPTESADCKTKNAWSIDCSEGDDFTCEGIGNSETVNVTLMFDNTSVPVNETTYVCQAFDLPDDKEYHLFASKPEIDNRNVMHHSIVFGCDPALEDVGFATPGPCGMTGGLCYQVLASWSLGQNGECLLSNTGVLVGKGHYTKVVVQKHWNNPTNEADYYDTSGITMYLTPTLREHNLAYFNTGPKDLVIPPNSQSFIKEGLCSSKCTAERLDGSIFIASSHLHMHYLGAAGKIEQWRDGQLVETWFDERSYSYDWPIYNRFSTPIELKPGDEIKTICDYKSTTRTEITYFGWATSDEMCFGFMSYYPAAPLFRECESIGDQDTCDLERTTTPRANSTEKDDSSAASMNALPLGMLMIISTIAAMLSY